MSEEYYKDTKCQKLTQAMVGGCPDMLYQTLEKRHLDPENLIPTDAWEEFVGDLGDNFADEVSELGNEYLSDWCDSKKCGDKWSDWRLYGEWED